MRTPLRVAVLCSHRAPGLAHLLTVTPSSARPWQVVCCLTSAEDFQDRSRVERLGLPVIEHPVRSFYASRHPLVRLSDLEVRAEYDAATIDKLEPFRPDVVMLAGYLLVLTRPMLDRFPGRIFNVHHADLLLSSSDGRPLYPGLRAVRDAILAGEHETRATSHIVTEQVDDGPPLVRSWPFAVPTVARWAIDARAADLLRSIVWVHQEWMLRAVFGPLMAQTLDLVADDALDGLVRDLRRDGSLYPPAHFGSAELMPVLAIAGPAPELI